MIPTGQAVIQENSQVRVGQQVRVLINGQPLKHHSNNTKNAYLYSILKTGPLRGVSSRHYQEHLVQGVQRRQGREKYSEILIGRPAR